MSFNSYITRASSGTSPGGNASESIACSHLEGRFTGLLVYSHMSSKDVKLIYCFQIHTLLVEFSRPNIGRLRFKESLVQKGQRCASPFHLLARRVR